MPEVSSKSQAQEIPALVPGVDLQRFGRPQPAVDETAQRLYAASQPSIVRISTDKYAGTGFFIDDQGTIATDAHVVLDTHKQFAVLADGRRHRLKVDRLDDVLDLAILKPVEPLASRPLSLGSSDQLKPADALYALGHPKNLPQLYVSPGQYTSKMTAMDFFRSNNEPEVTKELEAILKQANNPDFTAYHYRNLIAGKLHTEHGNSGGPVLDRQGKVVGLLDLGNDNHTQSLLTPIEALSSLQARSPSYRFNYEYQAQPWAGRYTDLMTNHTLRGLAVSATFGAAGGIALAGLARYPRVGGLAGVVTGAALLENDIDRLLKDQDSRDKLKYGLAAGADTALTIGSLALLAMRKKTCGLSMIGAGVISRLATDFIPNRYVQTSIERLDNRQGPLVGLKSFIPDIQDK